MSKTDIEKLRISLEAQNRIYKDLPNTTATFSDILRVNEVFLELIDNFRKPIGFK